MKQEMKDKWISDLRSGEYTQGEGHLCYLLDDDIEAFCCLGVLAKTQGDKFDFWIDGPENYRWITNVGDSEEYQNDEFDSDILKRIGMSVAFQTELIEMNDGGSSFAKIADYIEENLPVE